MWPSYDESNDNILNWKYWAYEMNGFFLLSFFTPGCT